MIYLVLFVGIYMLQLLLKMHWITILAFTLYLLLLLPVHRRRYQQMQEEKLRFTETTEYLDTLLYAFLKEEKVERALENAEAALMDGPMREKVREALEHLHMTFDDTEVMRESLRIIENAYPCGRVETVHDFIVHVEKFGGRIERPVHLLLEDKNRWQSRILLAMKDRSKMFTDIIMSIGVSILICGIILYMPVMDIDISKNVLCQLLTFVMLVLDDLIFLRAQRFMAADWLRLDVSIDEEEAKQIKNYRNYNPRREQRISVFLAIPFFAVAVISLWLKRQSVSAIGFAMAVFMLNQHRIGHRLARKNIVKSLKCAFPNWLMDIVLLMQSENVQMAMRKSQTHAPAVLKEDLRLLNERLEMEPEAAEPYHAFLQEFGIPEVHAAMSMLFSISMGNSNQADRQLGELIDRNLKMLDAAEKERIANLGSGMYLLFLAPVLSASLKLVVDMAVFMLSFITGTGI